MHILPKRKHSICMKITHDVLDEINKSAECRVHWLRRSYASARFLFLIFGRVENTHTAQTHRNEFDPKHYTLQLQSTARKKTDFV